MSSRLTQILLLGAGELGTALHASISSLPNTHITIGVRDPSKYTHLQQATTSLTTFDLTSPSHTLTHQFASYDIIVSATGFTSAPGSVTKLATEVLAAGKLRAQRGDPELWFFPWQWGVDYDVTGDGAGLMPLFGEQQGVRTLLRTEAEQNNVVWTIVSTGVFMSFLFEPFWGIVDRSGEENGVVTVRCLRDWNHGVTVTDVQDIGRVLARVLVGDIEAKNRVLYVAGESVQYGQLADVVEEVSGCKVVREPWSVGHLREELRSDPDDGIKKYRLVFAGDGVYWDKETTVNHQLGMPMMGVEKYARKLFGIHPASE
ncbi:hypothetical protein E8E13_005151 [Curvularia kusanoi]|uniref:NmrA-like domain-containing protein n=1 Tax=Curvularia kusanoi TaxID=90978 RepID=A0A9P4W912_CURKU|nr:hypothetical protein E8E13_005151 [Curvularia kusanoi]